MKGIILAGGSRTWLYPLTRVASEQLLPTYDKPMIYYPLPVLMNAGIRDILIISTLDDTPRFGALLGNGHQFSTGLSYAVQPSPDGLAQAFIIDEEFIDGDSVIMVLGDNILHGQGLIKRLRTAMSKEKGTMMFGYYMDGLERSSIVEFDRDGKAIFAEERPERPEFNYCVTDLYLYNSRAMEYTKNLESSARSRPEVTDSNRIYLEKSELDVILLGQGSIRLDTGIYESLMETTNFVKTAGTHQHRKIACLEETAYLGGWATREQVVGTYETLKKNQCGKYLKDVLDGKYVDKIHPQDF